MATNRYGRVLSFVFIRKYSIRTFVYLFKNPEIPCQRPDTPPYQSTETSLFYH